MIFEGSDYPDVYSPAEFHSRVQRSRGFDAGFQGLNCNSSDSDWIAGWERGHVATVAKLLAIPSIDHHGNPLQAAVPQSSSPKRKSLFDD